MEMEVLGKAVDFLICETTAGNNETESVEHAREVALLVFGVFRVPEILCSPKTQTIYSLSLMLIKEADDSSLEGGYATVS